MMHIKLFFLSAVMVCLCLAVMIGGPAPAFADTLVLTSGQKIEGDFIKKNDMYVMLNVQGKPITYYWGEVKSFDHPQPAPVINKKAPIAVKPIAPQLTEQQAYLRALASFVKSLKSDKKKDALKDFVVQYPQGRFAQDAQFVDLMLRFGKVLKKARSLAVPEDAHLTALEGKIASFTSPQDHGQITAETSRFIKRKAVELSKICVHPESVLLPYGLAGYYAQGMLAFVHKDYAASLKQFNFLKNAYEWRGSAGILGQMVFLQIMASEMAMGDDAAALSTSREAMEYFSHSDWSKSFYEFVQNQKDQWY